MSSQQSPTATPNTDVRYGDYIGVDFWGNKVVPVWTDERAGGFDMDIYTAVIDITTGIQPVAGNVPAKFELMQNYPNPFNPTTNINFSIPKKSNVTLSVFDITGKEVANLISGDYEAGEHTISWDASSVSSGVYFYKLTTTDGFNETRKMILIK